ncbi:hypothetical protein [Mucilaginibacter antarcticus]|uniref:hypothetical protein n=1 Tax=Mucilaginibacter antarcticus TaxID=1855725 RepID=UPI0036360D40
MFIPASVTVVLGMPINGPMLPIAGPPTVFGGFGTASRYALTFSATGSFRQPLMPAMMASAVTAQVVNFDKLGFFIFQALKVWLIML